MQRASVLWLSFHKHYNRVYYMENSLPQPKSSLQPMQFVNRIPFICFFIIAGIQLLAIATSIDWLRQISKPLLMPVLAWALYCNTPKVKGRYLLIVALLFSWAGDCLLMFDQRHELFFIGGLICFLLTHILYIIYFLSIKGEQASFLKSKPYLALPVPLYCIALLWVLYPHLGNLTLPVIVYAIVIGSMLLAAIHAYTRLKPVAAILFVWGAILFIASDSTLAINKFLPSFAGASFLIMLTYCAAQLCIVWAFVLQHRKG